MGNKCMFCQPEEEAEDVGEADACDKCVEQGLKAGWLKESANKGEEE